MKRLRHKLLSLILASAMLLTMIPAPAFAAESEMILRVSQVSAVAGSTVQVKLELENNPGLAALKVKVAFDDVLTLTGVAFNSGMGGQYQNPQTYASPVSLTWYNGAENFTGKNTTFATLTFQVSESATAGEVVDLVVTYNPSDVYDITETDIALNVINGSVTVLDCVPGDINGDGVTNLKDLSRLFQYLADWDVVVNEPALDTNGDGSVNLKDQSRLFQYLADWDVELYPKVNKACDHVLTAVEAKAATCEAEGNTAYWHCSECNGYFSDADATTKIQQADTIKAKLPHTEVSYSEPGYLPGTKCSVCGEIIKPSLPADGNVRVVTYEIDNGNSYIQSQINSGAVSNPNPQYISNTETYTLKNPTIAGYTFLGWYDLPAGDAAENVKKLTPGDGIDTLYAHWKLNTYTIQFKSNLSPIDSISYTVETGAVLNPPPKISNYVFAGWCDDEGNMYAKDAIPVGTTGHITLTANWISERNKTITKTTLDDPLIYEDDENGILYFAYEIGRVENVPLQVIHDFGYLSSDGPDRFWEETYSITTEASMVEAYSKVISEATTKSSNWTLSDGWSQNTSVDTEWLEQTGMTESEAIEKGTSKSGEFYISKSTGGSTTTVDLDTSESGWTNEVKIENSREDTETSKTAIGVGSKVGANFHGIGAEVTTSKDTEDSTSTTNKYGFSAGGSMDGTTLHTDSTETNSNWNTDKSYTSSKTSSQTETATTELSKLVSENHHYGESYILNQNTEETQGVQSSASSDEEYSASVTYSTIETEERTESWTTEVDVSGYYRWIVAGTAHVYGVVGYDIANDAYFVNTLSIMDDETHYMTDFSYTSAAYSDNQNGVISFEVPYEVAEYVAEKICCSDELSVNQATGEITGYTGTDNCVVIPEYMSVGDGDVIKVTGIGKKNDTPAFAGNEDIDAVVLSDYITNIPDGAFKDCTSLEGVLGGSIASIGSYAFSGCTALEVAGVSSKVTSLGDNAFVGVNKLVAAPSSASVLNAVVNSGAKSIVINMSAFNNNDDALNGLTITVPAGTEYFELNGSGKSFEGLSIVSHADQTVLKKISLISRGNTIPLTATSSDVILNQVSLEAPGIALSMAADVTRLGLQSTIDVTTAKCRTLALYETHSTVDGLLAVSDTLYTVNETVLGAEYLDCKNIVIISDDAFDSTQHTSRVIFDANGGTVNGGSSVSRTQPIGQPYGTLPVPTREYYTFDGWYTAKTGGTEITESSVFASAEPITLYAHWTRDSFTVTFNANGGTVSTTSMKGYCGQALGTLPVPTRDYYAFNGWYTAKTGGTKVTETSVYETTSTVSLYAQWTQNPVSEWVKASEVPSDAQIVDRKYKYSLTSYKTSDKSSLSGWTKYDTTWEWGDYSDWSEWSETSATASDSQKVETRTVYEYGYFVCSACGFHWHGYGINCFTYAGGCGATNTVPESSWISAYGTIPQSQMGFADWHGTTHTYANYTGYVYEIHGDGTCVNTYYDNVRVFRNKNGDDSLTLYCYCTRDKVYTYYFKKTESKESTTYPTGENISNIVEWVKYRAK